MKKNDRNRNTDPFAAQLTRAAQLSQSGQPEQAKAAYDEVLAQNPGHLGANLGIAELLMQHNFLPASAQHWRNALAVDGSNFGARFNYARVLHRLGSFALAIVEINSGLAAIDKLGSRKPPAEAIATVYLQRAYAEESLHDEAAAERSLQQAVELHPDYAEAHMELGYVQSKLGQVEASQASLRRTIALDPAHALAHRTLAFSKKHTELDAEVQAMQALYDSGTLDVRNQAILSTLR